MSKKDTGFYQRNVYAGTFLVEVDGQPIGRFKEISGLQVDVEVEQIEEGGQNAYVHKVPGRITWPNLVLKRGLTETNNLIAWLDGSSGNGFAKNGHKLTRSTLAITLISHDGKRRLRSWAFHDAFPVKWTGPSFSYDSSDMADEELEIAHHGFTATDYVSLF